MSKCPCELLGSRLQGPAHRLHQEAGERLQQAAALAPRYLAALLRRPRPTASEDPLLRRFRSELRSIHQAAAQYLPPSDERCMSLTSPDAIREHLENRRN